MKKIVLYLMMLSAWQQLFANQVNPKVSDTLTGKSCTYLSQAFDINKKDTVKSLAYARAWLANAKSINDWSQVTMAYKALMHNSSQKERIAYADSMVAAAMRTSDAGLIGSAYLSRGVLYYSLEEHTKALDNYIVADDYISKIEDTYLIHKVKYAIALTKMYLGFYDESLAIMKECVNFYHDQNDTAYLNSLHALGLCYNRLGRLDLSTDANRSGIEFSKEIGDSTMVPYFMHSEAVNSYFRKEYQRAITDLSAALVKLIARNDRATTTIAYFYLGKSYWAIGNKEKALVYLKKVDDAFIRHGYTRPEIRETYELLINYYKDKDDQELQLF